MRSLHARQVRAGEPAGAQAVLADQPLDHARRRRLAVGARDVDDPVRLLRVAQQLHDGERPVERRVDLVLGRARQDPAVDLVGGRAWPPSRPACAGASDRSVLVRAHASYPPASTASTVACSAGPVSISTDSASVSRAIDVAVLLDRGHVLRRDVEREQDPVPHLQAGGLAGVLDDADDVAGVALGAQLVVERRGRARRTRRPAGPRRRPRALAARRPSSARTRSARARTSPSSVVTTTVSAVRRARPRHVRP